MTKCNLCKDIEVTFNYDLPRWGKPYTVWDVLRDIPHKCKYIDQKTGKYQQPEKIAGRDYNPKWLGGRLCWHCGCTHNLEDLAFFRYVPPCIETPDAYNNCIVREEK